MATPPFFAVPAIAVPTTPTVPPLVERTHQLLFGDTEMLRRLAASAGGLAINLGWAVLILVGTLWAARWLSHFTAQAIGRAHRQQPADTTLQTFLSSLVRYIVIIVGAIAVLNQLGVQATSVLAVLGAASLAIGLALQGALSNVAAGVMLLILRPYRVGDMVIINGTTGTVRGLDLFSTRLSDADNLHVFIPNGKAFGETIVNYSATGARRMVIEVAIDYDDDVDGAIALLLACAADEPRVIAKPAPWAKLTQMGDSGVTVTLRAWSKPGDAVDTRFDLMKAIKARFEAAGFSFPYPHQVAVESRPFDPPHSKVAHADTPPAKPKAAATRATPTKRKAS